MGPYWAPILGPFCTPIDTAGVGVVTVRQFEGESGTPRGATLVVIAQALEAAGLEFIPENGGGAGIRFRERKAPAD